MLVSTPTKAFDPTMSPKYNRHRRHYTPPSKGANSPYDSPMLSPSPLRGRPLFPLSTNVPDSDDMPHFPYSSPAQALSSNPFYVSKPQAIPADDEEGHIFLASRASAFGGASSSKPLLTPKKQAKRIPSRSALTASLAAASADPVSRGAGTKRKSTPSNATPLRPVTLTPLKLTKSNDNGSGVCFDRLAPLAALKFSTKTPQTRAETEAHLTRQTATLTRLRLSDPDGLDFNPAADDSGVDMDDDDSLHTPSPTKRKHIEKIAPSNLLVIDTFNKGKGKEEVAEAISPGGHINKRRARSRPVSAELLETALKSPNHSPLKQNIKPSAIPCRVGVNRPRHSAPVAFPSTSNRGRGSPSSSTEGSPRPRRRISATTRPPHLPPLLPRPQLSRIESGSSATFFFGPAIPQTATPSIRSRISTLHPTTTPAIPRTSTTRPQLTNRHSYAGPGTSSSSSAHWNTVQTRDVSPSPGSSPFLSGHKSKSSNNSMDWEDEDSFFTADERSTDFKLITHSPSPTSKAAIPKKFKARNSLTISDDDDILSANVPDLLSAGPQASTSLSSVSDDGLVTPICGPDGGSGWPSVFVSGLDRSPDTSGIDVDEFIQKTLAEASKFSTMPKRAPGTPVKKARVSYFGHERPWQSAVAPKVGLKDDCEFKKMPRKSLPAAFPALAMGAGPKTAKLAKIASTERQPIDTEDEEENSPSTRKGDRYTGLGLGQPTSSQTLVNDSSMSSIIRSRWPVIRRSSSGAFSSGSDASLSNTPTRTKGIDWQLSKPRIPLRFSPSSDALRTTSRSTSGSSSSSIISSPTISRTAAAESNSRPRLSRPSLINIRRYSDTYTEEEKPGRFERDFDELEQVGSGEFGQVLKVRSKNGDGEVFAVKKSKRFEGAKHRLRLREEVDILHHLSQAALSKSFAEGRHPNVLGYIDSWEEDEALYIRTELCESGNLARFLWEYGRVFPRLDEARVWKIIADLSSGLRFIHDSGVIHLDLKPANVFVTKEGRFKIGDFGMASLWPRPAVDATSECAVTAVSRGGFEREGDKLYLAPEVLQGRYSKAADMFSFGMTILETATNIVVPDQGDAWHRLRNEDFAQVDLEGHSEKLVELIQMMMRREPQQRLSIAEVWAYPPVVRAREKMETMRTQLSRQGENLWGASPLASVSPDFLDEILDMNMDTTL